jgi:hypothetical protein
VIGSAGSSHDADGAVVVVEAPVVVVEAPVVVVAAPVVVVSSPIVVVVPPSPPQATTSNARAARAILSLVTGVDIECLLAVVRSER